MKGRISAAVAVAGVAMAAVGAAVAIPALAYQARSGEGFVLVYPAALVAVGFLLAAGGWLTYLATTTTPYRPPNAGTFGRDDREEV